MDSFKNLEGVAQKLSLPRPFDVLDILVGNPNFGHLEPTYLWHKAGSDKVYQLVIIDKA